jgi:hypothetical protein
MPTAAVRIPVAAPMAYARVAKTSATREDAAVAATSWAMVTPGVSPVDRARAARVAAQTTLRATSKTRSPP